MIGEILGVIALLIALALLLRIAISVFPWLLPEQNLHQKYCGGSALITGGTDGIGLEIARKLLAQGINVRIVGLHTGKIPEHELPPGSSLIEGDLGDPEILHSLCSWISENSPALLIHCSGFCIPMSFESYPNPGQYVQSHVSSLVELTQAFIAARPAKSGIVFFSSQVAFWSSPFAALYAATKAFTGQFATSIAAEYPSIDVLCLFPGAVNGTSFFSHFPQHWYFKLIQALGQSPSGVASLVFRSIGRIRLVDSGVLTMLTRIATAFVDANIINFIGGIAVDSLRPAQSAFHKQA
jgi:short-subunit dehydrogenase